MAFVSRMGNKLQLHSRIGPSLCEREFGRREFGWLALIEMFLGVVEFS